MSAFEFLAAVLSSVLASTALVAALAWLLETWIGERLRQGIRHVYAKDLEAFRIELSAASDRVSGILTTAAASFHGVHVAGVERRTRAIEAVWKACLDLRAGTAAGFFLVDVARINSSALLENPSLVDSVKKNLKLDGMLNVLVHATKDLEQHRPFIGDQAWASLNALRAMPVALSTLAAMEPTKVFEWDSPDSSVRTLLASVLSTEELVAIDRTENYKLATAWRIVEDKLLRQLSRAASGEGSGELALEQAQRHQQALSEIERLRREAETVVR